MRRPFKPTTESPRAQRRKALRSGRRVDVGTGGTVSLLRGQNRRAGQRLWLRKES